MRTNKIISLFVLWFNIPANNNGHIENHTFPGQFNNRYLVHILSQVTDNCPGGRGVGAKTGDVQGKTI